MADALKIALILTAVDKASDVFDKANKRIKSGLVGLERSKAILNSYSKQAMLVGGVAATAFGLSLHAAEENEIAVKRLEQVYRSMGRNVQEASKHSQEYASKLEFQIGVEDEAIMAVQAKIATFKSVSDATALMNGHFDRATKLAFDLQATGFGEASSNAVQLGKALEDPVKGITALRKAGITFTETEKKRIAVLMAANKATEAQELVLKAIESQVGGVAEATTTSTAKAKVAWSEVTETLGKALLPTFTNIVNKITEIIPKIQTWIENNSTLVKWIAAISVGLIVLGVAFKLASVGIAVYETAMKVVTALQIPFVASGGVVLLIIAAIAAAAYLIYDNWDAILEFLSDLWDGVKKVFLIAWKWIKKIFWDYQPAVLIYNNWGKIVDWFKNIWDKVQKKFWDFIDFLKTLPGKFVQAGRDIINGIWDGMKSVWADVQKWFEDAWKWITDKLKIFDFQSKIQEMQQEVIIKAQAAGASASIPSSKPTAYNSVSKSNSSTMHFSPTIQLSGTATQQDGANISGELKKQFTQWYKDMQNNQQRTAFS